MASDSDDDHDPVTRARQSRATRGARSTRATQATINNGEQCPIKGLGFSVVTPQKEEDPSLHDDWVVFVDGMLEAEVTFGALHEGVDMDRYWDALRNSWIWEELHKSRNYQPKIVTSLALSDSENVDVRLSGKIFCMARIEELCANLGSLSCHDQIHNIIVFLKQTEGLSKHVDSFMQILSLVQFKDTPPFVLTPLLPDEMYEADFLRW
ncbi:hypothetical protein Fmac_018560 [Flemingia macrophylla]|uniref:Uncharacterized protein n=1 Tax=Flemingia macrophylla TaxID=520843 RepID=A0ABD1M5C7_9FABA